MSHSSRQIGCYDFRQSIQFSRREALRLGGICGLGLSLPQLIQQQSFAKSNSPTFGRAKRVIMLFLHGGHPQQETFDPKPNGPSAVKGEFGAIETSLPGVQYSEVLPLTAKIAHKLTVIRSVTHDNSNHVTACLPAQTGHKHPPNTPRTDFPPTPNDFPPFGAVLDHLRPTTKPLPTWVRVGPLMRRSNGTTLHGQTPGFLGTRHSSFVVDQKLRDKDVEVKAVQPVDEMTTVRLSSRQDLLRQFDQQRQIMETSQSARSLNTYYDRAFRLLTSDATRQAFDLKSEPENLRQRYGETEFGQRCLLARRLAEAGVPLVNVSYCHTPSGSWDTHSQNFKKMKGSLAPTLDMALTALVDDLEERGMLDDTLVVVNAEFGRTPKINGNAGRDHWPWVYSLAFAGGGMNPGTVFGASDNSAAYPADQPRGQEDIAATIYHLLGIDPGTILYDAENRPHHLVIGKPVHELFA
ncbi:MAG: DUF1501 domain-containing protein [Planctomycetaceae bacterium]|nr:DUF1501 domain-containing protein [Planctomycetaceae bacterium]